MLQYTALNMNYSVAGFQVDCLVNNFPKGLLVAIYAGKSISSALEDERGALCFEISPLSDAPAALIAAQQTKQQ